MSPSSTPLAGKTAVVTGASRSIGYGIALKLAQQGANVSVARSQRYAGPSANIPPPRSYSDTRPRPAHQRPPS